MEHCVYCFVLSEGKDYRDCGRPCEKHSVELRDQKGVVHPLHADAGCRNTLFNGQAQSAASFIPRMVAAGIKNYRIDLVTETADEVAALVRTYRDLIDGKTKPSVSRSLNVISQLGVSGTLGRE